MKDSADLARPRDLDKAIARIKSREASCVLMREGLIAGEAVGIGVKPILQFLESGELRGAQVADKVIGKAAAMLLVLGGVVYVYGEIMSESGRDYLQGRGIAVSWGKLVEGIINRDGTDICPLERAVDGVWDPREGYEAIRGAIDVLMGRG